MPAPSDSRRDEAVWLWRGHLPIEESTNTDTQHGMASGRMASVGVDGGPATATAVGRRLLRIWLVWTASFLAFPLGGLAGRAIVGPVDNPRAALIGGLATGLVIGAGQTLALALALGGWRHRRLGWVLATGAGQAVGLLAGAAAVRYGTGLADLALMGVLTGIPTGIAQAFALPAGLRHRWAWAAAAPILWGWAGLSPQWPESTSSSVTRCSAPLER
jgi:hypothetical protein